MTEGALEQPSVAARARPWRDALRAYAVPLGVSLAIGATCVSAILARAGHPALPLDDSFIHLQYARRLAEGSFFGYVPGEGYTTGATSLLWPLALAPFHLLGLHDLSLVWIAWLFGALGHAAVAVETTRLAEPLAGRAAAVGAGAMSLAFGAFAWFAWSGMETIFLAWILLRTARVAAEWCEAGGALAPTGTRSDRARVELVVLGLAAPLIRPEGALASLVAAAALAGWPAKEGRPRLRALGLAPLLGPLLMPLLHLALAGHATSSTTLVKWLLVNPYYRGPALREAVLSNLRLLLTSLLDGGDYTALFLPEGSAVPIYLGAIALFVVALRRRTHARAAFTLVVALGALLPCTYLSFLWNRVRYIWPFAGAWFVLVACLARELGDLARRADRRLGFVTPAIAFAFAGALATKLPWTVRDLAQSASAIDRQQVTLARWVSENLPPDARIGVNDTGAIAYLGGRRTFDVVGLTTEGEAPYWIAGAGSRFEHYERLPRERLPTHFVVYPQWMACPPVLGAELVDATVLDQSILGGATMVGYAARWDLLGSGASPAIARHAGAPLDEVDVADLESEAAHGFALEGGMDVEDRVSILRVDVGPRAGQEIADGYRANRGADHFFVRVPPDRPARLVMRLGGEEPSRVAVSVAGRAIGEVSVPFGWGEQELALPASAAGEHVPVALEARGGARFTSLHYWVYAD